MLLVNVRPARKHLVIAPVGEIDFFTVPLAREAVRDALGSGWRDIVLDLREVTFMDSAGAKLLLELRSRSVDGVRFLMVEPPRPVRRVLDLVDAPRVLPRIEPHQLSV